MTIQNIKFMYMCIQKVCYKMQKGEKVWKNKKEQSRMAQNLKWIAPETENGSGYKIILGRDVKSVSNKDCIKGKRDGGKYIKF